MATVKLYGPKEGDKAVCVEGSGSEKYFRGLGWSDKDPDDKPKAKKATSKKAAKG